MRKFDTDDTTVTIAFEGLMFFQTGDGHKKEVVVVDGTKHHHHPHIEILRSEDGTAGGNLQPYKKLALGEDDVVTFDVAEGQMTRSALYNQFVPELRRYIAAGDIDGKVTRQETKKGAIDYVNLPPGDLTIWGTLKTSVALMTSTGHLELKCFARFVMLATTTSPTRITIHHRKSRKGDESYDLEPTDFVIVSNISHEMPGGVHHFELYSQLLTAGGHVGSFRDGNTECPSSSGKGVFREPIERVLVAKDSHFIPNADCGPTGP
jgi:hypothetical protein